MWSCICCCSSRNKAQTRSQKGSYFSKGRVHPLTRIEKWEERITEANSSGKILVPNFKASWCLPCRKIAPNIPGTCVHIHLDDEFSNAWNVEATPTVMFLKDGRQMDKLVGRCCRASEENSSSCRASPHTLLTPYEESSRIARRESEARTTL